MLQARPPALEDNTPMAAGGNYQERSSRAISSKTFIALNASIHELSASYSGASPLTINFIAWPRIFSGTVSFSSAGTVRLVTCPLNCTISLAGIVSLRGACPFAV